MIGMTDGLSRGNPGLSAYAWVLLYEDGELFAFSYGLLPQSNSVTAEWLALNRLLKYCHDSHLPLTELRMDANTLLQQIRGETSFDRNQELLAETRPLLSPQTRLYHVPRAYNQSCDALANLAANRRIKPHVVDLPGDMNERWLIPMLKDDLQRSTHET